MSNSPVVEAKKKEEKIMTLRGLICRNINSFGDCLIELARDEKSKLDATKFSEIIKLASANQKKTCVLVGKLFHTIRENITAHDGTIFSKPAYHTYGKKILFGDSSSADFNMSSIYEKNDSVEWNPTERERFWKLLKNITDLYDLLIKIDDDPEIIQYTFSA